MRKSEHIDELKLGPFLHTLFIHFHRATIAVLTLGYGLGLYQGPFHVHVIYAMFVFYIFSSYMIVKKCIFIYLFKKDCYGWDSNPQQQNKLD